jgi:hypothetical protein
MADSLPLFLMNYIVLLFKLLSRQPMVATFQSDINYFRSSLFHLTVLPKSQKGRAAKVKDVIISEAEFLGTISVDRYSSRAYRSVDHQKGASLGQALALLSNIRLG